MSKITNIVLENNRFKVFAIVGDREIINIFMPDVTSEEIQTWFNDEVAANEMLLEKERELKNALVK